MLMHMQYVNFPPTSPDVSNRGRLSTYGVATHFHMAWHSFWRPIEVHSLGSPCRYERLIVLHERMVWAFKNQWAAWFGGFTDGHPFWTPIFSDIPRFRSQKHPTFGTDVASAVARLGAGSRTRIFGSPVGKDRSVLGERRSCFSCHK